MVQATHFRNLDDHAEFRWFDWPSVGCVFAEREMSARPVMVGEVAGQDAVQVPFAPDRDMVQALAPDRADEPLREGVLLRAGARRQHLTDPQALPSMPELLAVDLVAIAEEIGRRSVVREGLHDLLGGPMYGGVFGHVDVDDSPTAVGKHDEDEEDSQARGGDREEIEGD
jgi:hypothetical protein